MYEHVQKDYVCYTDLFKLAHLMQWAVRKLTGTALIIKFVLVLVLVLLDLMLL
jgi:hypothetical protein